MKFKKHLFFSAGSWGLLSILQLRPELSFLVPALAGSYLIDIDHLVHSFLTKKVFGVSKSTKEDKQQFLRLEPYFYFFHTFEVFLIFVFWFWSNEWGIYLISSYFIRISTDTFRHFKTLDLSSLKMWSLVWLTLYYDKEIKKNSV